MRRRDRPVRPYWVRFPLPPGAEDRPSDIDYVARGERRVRSDAPEPPDTARYTVRLRPTPAYGEVDAQQFRGMYRWQLLRLLRRVFFGDAPVLGEEERSDLAVLERQFLQAAGGDRDAMLALLDDELTVPIEETVPLGGGVYVEPKSREDGYTGEQRETTVVRHHYDLRPDSAVDTEDLDADEKRSLIRAGRRALGLGAVGRGRTVRLAAERIRDALIERNLTVRDLKRKLKEGTGAR